MVLADTNLVIYAAGTAYPTVRAWVAVEQPFVSSATRVEALGFHKLTPASEADLLSVFGFLTVLQISPSVEDEAIRLRRQRRMSLGDSFVAATALVHGCKLATKNLKDFTWIPGLTVFDPS